MLLLLLWCVWVNQMMRMKGLLLIGVHLGGHMHGGSDRGLKVGNATLSELLLHLCLLLLLHLGHRQRHGRRHHRKRQRGGGGRDHGSDCTCCMCSVLGCHSLLDRLRPGQFKVLVSEIYG